jgi:MFS family permease
MSSLPITDPAPYPKGLRGYAALLSRNSNIRTLWFGQLSSYLGDWFNTIAVLGLLVELTNDASSAAISIATGILPAAVAGIFLSGVVADRFNRKLVMVGADLIRAAIALLYLLVDTPERVWLAYFATGALSFVSAFFYPASSASIPNLATRQELPLVGTLGQTTFATTIFLGSIIGGAVSQFFGRDVCFIVNSVSFVLSAIFIARARGEFNVDKRLASSGANGLRIIFEGARYLRTNINTRTYVLIKLAWSWVFGGMGLYSVFGLTVYGVGDAATAWLYAGRGVGAFISPLLFSTIFSVQDQVMLRRAIRVGLFVSLIGYTTFSLSVTPWQGILGTFLGHGGGALVWTFSNILVQSSTPDHVRGRVMALDSVITSGVMAVSSLLAGFIAAQTGNPHIGGLSVVTLSVMGVAIWFVWARGR